MADENSAEAPAEEGATPGKGGGKSRILILLVVAMVGEAGLFYFLGIGSGGEPAAAAGEDAVVEPAKPEPDTTAELVEVEVHSFNVTNNMAAADSIVHIAFKLHALVATDQQAAFTEAVTKKHSARVREAVEKIARSATLEDLNDPTLSTLKRLLREEINKVLRQSYIIEVVFSDFKTMEQ